MATSRRSRLIIGLDYGTTYTGISFCEISDATDAGRTVQIIQDWPAVHSMIGTKEKVPSEIAYMPNGDILWGSLIQPQTERHMWTKLNLDGQPITGGEAAVIRKETSRSTARSKTPVEIIADFLTKVKEHLVKNLDAQYGPDLWRSLDITVVVTVPAIWSDVAKHQTLRAVKKAGFNREEFPHLTKTVTTTEPEAAAMYTLRSLQGTVKSDDFEKGDGFMICDMGGGTVDLISYRIASKDPTTVEEATIGTGAQCGGSFVDREFLEWLEQRLGLKDFKSIAGCAARDCHRTHLTPKLGRLVREFILESKTGFSGKEDFYLRLPSPLSVIDDPSRDIVDGELHIQPEHLTKMFESCLNQTCDLIHGQLDAADRTRDTRIKYIFLVGGFAESPYMNGKIRERFASNANLKVVKPPFAWSAVVRGAIEKDPEDAVSTVVSRKCRRHYGVPCTETFNRTRHDENDAFFDRYTHKKTANHQMCWVTAKGQSLQTSDQAHAEAYLSTRFWPNEHKDFRMKMVLYACDSDEAPKQIYRSGLYKVAELDIPMCKVPKAHLEKRYDPNGRMYFAAETVVHISLQAKLEYRVTVNDREYGSVTVKYDE